MYLDLQLEKASELLRKNHGPKVDDINEKMEEYLKELFYVCKKIYNYEFDDLNKLAFIKYTDKLIYMQFLKEYLDPMFYYFALYPEYSTYDYCILCAYNSIMHENYMGYYACLEQLLTKISKYERVFFSDKERIKSVIRLIGKKINLEYSFIYKCKYDTPEPELYYKECLIDCYIIGENERNYTTKSKYLEEPDSITNILQDFVEHMSSKDFKAFIYDIDNYLSVNPNNSTMWEYLAKALIVDYKKGYCMWDDELSKDILKAMIGYSKCFSNLPATRYTLAIRYIISEILSLINFVVNEIMSDQTLITKKWHIKGILLFLINLYYVFPHYEIIDLIDDILINMQYSDINIEYNLVETIRNIGEKELIVDINAGTLIQDGKIVNCAISKQSDKPKFTEIVFMIDMSKHSKVKVEFTFYDENMQKICYDTPIIMNICEDSPSCGNIYKTMIFEGSKIKKVEMDIIESTKKNTINTDTYKTINVYENEYDSNIDTQPNNNVYETKSDSNAQTVDEETGSDAILCIIAMMIILAIIIGFLSYGLRV